MVPCAGLHGPAGAGPAELSASLTIDLDSTIVPVFGRNKQGAAFGYTKIRGYHPQLATCAQTGQVMFSRLRGGAPCRRPTRPRPTQPVQRAHRRPAPLPEHPDQVRRERRLAAQHLPCIRSIPPLGNRNVHLGPTCAFGG
jgi:hypothetical protein